MISRVNNVLNLSMQHPLTEHSQQWPCVANIKARMAERDMLDVASFQERFSVYLRVGTM